MHVCDLAIYFCLMFRNAEWKEAVFIHVAASLVSNRQENVLSPILATTLGQILSLLKCVIRFKKNYCT
jgi:hypothetical protein